MKDITSLENLELSVRAAMANNEEVTNISLIIERLLKEGYEIADINKIITKINNYNHSLYESLRSDNNRFEKGMVIEKRVLPILAWNNYINGNSRKEPTRKQSKVNANLNLDFRNYMDMIVKSSGDFLTISFILDSINETKRKGYMYLILTELERQRIGLRKDLFGDLDNAEIELFSEEYEILSKAIDCINQYRGIEEENIELTVPTEDRKIVFLCDSFGEPYFLRDINGVDDSFYAGFLDLITGFEAGYDKNYKKIKGASDARQLSKGVSGERILLEQISNNFVVLGGFIKKSKIPGLRERKTMFNILGRYDAGKEQFFSELKEEDFMQKQGALLAETKTYLESRGKKR